MNGRRSDESDSAKRAREIGSEKESVCDDDGGRNYEKANVCDGDANDCPPHDDDSSPNDDAIVPSLSSFATVP